MSGMDYSEDELFPTSRADFRLEEIKVSNNSEYSDEDDRYGHDQTPSTMLPRQEDLNQTQVTNRNLPKSSKLDESEDPADASQNTDRTGERSEEDDTISDVSSVATDKVRSKFPEIEKELEASLSDTQVNTRGVYWSITVCVIFLLIILLVNRVERLSYISRSIKSRLEDDYWSIFPNYTFEDIHTSDDLDAYIREILLDVCFSNDRLLNDYLYAAGIRFVLKRAKLTENTYEDYEDAVKLVRESDYMSPETQDQGEDTNDFSIWNYEESNGYQSSGGVISTFLNETLGTALERWRIMKPLWLDQKKFSSLVIEIIFHNSNYRTTTYYYQIFDRTSAGILNVSSGFSGIFPEMFEEWNSSTYTILFLCIILLLGFMVQIYTLSQNLVQAFIRLFSRGELDIMWNEYIEMSSVILVVTCIIVFGSVVIGNIGKFKLPIETEDDFQDLVSYSQEFRVFIRLSALAALLVALKIIIALKNQYPSFGVLFDTIRGAKSDIINFSVISILLLTAFAMMGNLLFGYFISDFATLADSFVTLFCMMMASIKIESLQEVNYELANVFMIFFLALFFFILLNMFLAIVLATYIELRRRNQRLLEAKALILTEQANIIKSKWLAFLLCKSPVRELEKEALEYMHLSRLESNNPDDQELITVRMREIENMIKQQSKPDIFTTIKFNLGQVNVIKTGQNLQTREQCLTQLKNKIYQLEKKKLKEKKYNKKLENNVKHNFGLVKEMILHIIFIVIFALMVIFRLRVQDNYYIQASMEKYLNLSLWKSDKGDIYFQLEDIKTKEDMSKYILQVVSPIMTDGLVFDNNIWVPSIGRITLTRSKYDTNPLKSSNKIFPKVVSDDLEDLDESDFEGSVTGYHYKYTESGYIDTHKKMGGYIDALTSNYTHNKHVMDRWSDDQLHAIGVQDVYIEFIIYNGNINMYAYNYMHFRKWPSSTITWEIYTNGMELQKYKNENPGTILLEIAFGMFTLYHIFIEARAWTISWRKLTQERQMQKAGQVALSDILIKLGKVETENKTFCETLIGLFFVKLLVFMKWITELLNRFFVATWSHVTKNLYSIFQAASIVLSVIMLATTLQIISNDFRNEFDMSEDWDNYIGEFSHLDDLSTLYRNIAAFNCLLIFLRLLEYFKFSKELSILTTILDSAKFDLGFFLAMFAIILFAYSIMGYILLGHDDIRFNNISRSLLACYSILIGSSDIVSIKKADAVLGTFFYISYMILFNLLLLNMFIAIVGAHFESLSPKKGKAYKGFYQNVYEIVKLRWKKQKYMNPPKRKKSSESEISEEKKKYFQAEDTMDDFKILNVKHQLTSSILWISKLERKVAEQTNNRLNFANFKGQSTLFTDENKIIHPVSLGEIAFVDPDSWLNAEIYEQLSIWRQLSKCYQDFLRKCVEKSLQIGQVDRALPALSEIQINLWESLPILQKLNIWAGKVCLTPEEKISVWNCTSFNPQRIPFTVNENILVSDQKELWQTCTEENKKLWIQSIYEPYRTFIRFSNIYKNMIKKLSRRTDLHADFRMLLWSSMSNKDKLQLYINQPDGIEAEMICYLILEEKDNNVFLLEESDRILSGSLDAKFYDKLSALAEWQAENANTKEIEDEDQEFESNFKNVMEYKTYLVDQIEFFSNRKRQLKGEKKWIQSSLHLSSSRRF